LGASVFGGGGAVEAGVEVDAGAGGRVSGVGGALLRLEEDRGADADADDGEHCSDKGGHGVLA
jgi:hypothetical protein